MELSRRNLKLAREDWLKNTQSGEVRSIMRQVEQLEVFRHEYFCGHSIRSVEKANIESGVGLCRSWALSVAGKHRCHICVFFGWLDLDEDKRFHFHTKLYSDKPLKPRILKDAWYRVGGIGEFEPYEEDLKGEDYIFTRHYFENGFRPFCGVRGCCSDGVAGCKYRTLKFEIGSK